jgi:hypothetical protein
MLMLIRPLPALLFLLMAVAVPAAAQDASTTPDAPVQASQQDKPNANPGRPTVSTPATLTPVGYFQFEAGYLGAWHSPEFSSQSSVNDLVKFSLARRIELLAADQPFAYSRAMGQGGWGAGDVALGVQGVVLQEEGARPTIALSFFHRVYGGDAPDVDIGSNRNSVLILASADVKGFHYDTNFIFNEVIDSGIRRAQFGQTLSVSHSLPKKFGISGEIWHFTQPFLRSNAVGNLWALNYNARSNLVFGGGFNRGLTSTSTRWEVFLGFTYLLPRKLSLRHGA